MKTAENIILSRKDSIDNYREVYGKTLDLISLYKKADLNVPFSLKGNLGEFLVLLELLKRFPYHTITYKSGASPGVDMSIGRVRIQIKTQFKPPVKLFKNGQCDYESSPAVKKSTLDKKNCDILILIILYPSDDYSKITKRNIYIFDYKDFKFFDTKFCWSGCSKSDYTIVNCLSVKGEIPSKIKKIVNFYNNKKYKDLFKTSKDNWDKITSLVNADEEARYAQMSSN